MSSAGGSPMWAGEQEFREALKKMKKSTKGGVARLTDLALKGDPRQDYKHVVGLLCHQLRKTRPQHRVAIVHVLDAILRKSKRTHGTKDVYGKRMQLVLPSCFAALGELSPEHKGKVHRTVQYWQQHRLLEDEFVVQLIAALQAEGATATTSGPKADSSPSAGSATARSVRTPVSTEVASTSVERGGAAAYLAALAAPTASGSQQEDEGSKREEAESEGPAQAEAKPARLFDTSHSDAERSSKRASAWERGRAKAAAVKAAAAAAATFGGEGDTGEDIYRPPDATPSPPSNLSEGEGRGSPTLSWGARKGYSNTGEEVQSSGKSKSSVASPTGEAASHLVTGKRKHASSYPLPPPPPPPPAPPHTSSNGSRRRADAQPRRREEGQQRPRSSDGERHHRSPRRRDQKEKEHRQDRARVLLPGGVSP